MTFIGTKHKENEDAEDGKEQASEFQVAKSCPQISEGNSPEDDPGNPY
jgi:hypothetical protein